MKKKIISEGQLRQDATKLLQEEQFLVLLGKQIETQGVVEVPPAQCVETMPAAGAPVLCRAPTAGPFDEGDHPGTTACRSRT